MNISNSFTFGHRVAQDGNSSTYIGSTQTEGLAIGQKVSDSVKTEVQLGDKVVVSDRDSQPNLKVGIKKMAFGSALEIENSKGEFKTTTTIPVTVDESEMGKGASLDGGFDVTRVTVTEQEGVGTFVSLADTSGVGERGFLIADGKIQGFLRGA